MKASTIKWNWVLMLVFLLIPTYGFGQQGLTIAEASRGYVFLELGMDEGIAIERLKSKGFSVRRASDLNTYAITIKTKGDLHKPVGLISFTNKRLSYISRNWYESLNNMQAFELADKLYHLLEKQTEGRGEVKATIILRTDRILEREIKKISIIEGNKKILLDITEGEKNSGGYRVGVSEQISDKPFKY